MEERINHLESLAALQDKTLAELNAEVFRQQRDLGRLLQRIEALEKRLERFAQQPEQTAEAEKPPHW